MPISITVDGKAIKCEPTQTILEICRSNNIYIPTLCFMEGLSNVGACRLCLVEIEGVSKLLPACTTRPADGQKIKTDSEKLKKYRKMTIELFFSERNHVCSVCVANNNCQLQDLAYQVGMTKVRFPYLYQECNFDGSHELFNIDHNRCVLCTRCVRACNEVEGAYNWGVMGRGYQSRIIADFNQPWGESVTCTSCGKCVEACPVGAIWPKGTVQGKLTKSPELVSILIKKRKNLY